MHRAMTVGHLHVDVVRKRMRHMRLTVCTPDGNVRVSGPFHMTDHAVHEMVTTRLAWIRKHQGRIAAQERPVPPRYVSGERVRFMGHVYRLEVMCHDGPGRVFINDDHTMHLVVPEGCDAGVKERVLLDWFRDQLKTLLPPLISRWESILGVKVAEWGIKQMKTRWGTCNVKARRVWFGLALATKPPQCLDYIVAHELMHLLVRNHGKGFYALMDTHLPTWRACRAELRNH